MIAVVRGFCEKKEFFDQAGINKVKEAGRIFKAPYTDRQGDAINEVLTQGEPLQNFDKPEDTPIQRTAAAPPKESGQKIEVGHDKFQVNVQVDVKEKPTT